MVGVNSLTSKQVIKIADKVCRIISKEFPAVSPSRTQPFIRTKAHNIFLHKKDSFLENNLRPAYNTKRNPLEFYKSLVELVKKHKLASCNDYSRLSHLIMGLNGIDVYSAKLSGAFLGRNAQSHAISFLAPSKFRPIGKLTEFKKGIVIDSWIGFADNAQKAAEKYTKEFSRFSGFNDMKKVFVDATGIQDYPITPDIVEYFRKYYPQFFIKK